MNSNEPEIDTMKKIIEKILNEYVLAKQEIFAGHELGTYFRDVIPKAIYSTGIVDRNKYLITGSVGQGNWATVPWICIFDKNITKSATKGVYIVYLLAKDGKTLYLTFNQGCTEIKKTHSKQETIRIMRKRAAEISKQINSRDFFVDEKINLGDHLTDLAEFYQKGTIFYKEYRKNSIPSENELRSDLLKMIAIYKEYAEKNSKEYGDEKMPISTKEIINKIKEYIAAKGFLYKDKLIENFFLSLKSKPFVILAGTSGTGKTRLVKLFAEAIGAGYKLVSVRPDWSDGSDLFGHYDLNRNFIDGPVCECFKAAYENPSKPVFICLDEMNLARVEHYFSDFLSVIESREKQLNGKIVTEPIAQYKEGIPDNLYIVGTVNMDETTFPFSKKVLDRANTIEFSYVDLMPVFDSIDSAQEKLLLPNSFLHTEYLVLSKDCIDEHEYVYEICSELQIINKILLKDNAHVGYRVRDEIVFYMLNNKAEGNLLTYNEAFDNEIMQKILPRIQGNSVSARDMLCELFKFCAADFDQKMGDSDSEKMYKVLNDEAISCRYRKSAEKIKLMVKRFEEDGFTSYWL